jgi:hypothetical protein
MQRLGEGGRRQVVSEPLWCSAAAAGGSIVRAVLGSAIHTAIVVIVTHIPWFSSRDQLTAPPADDVAGVHQWLPCRAQCSVIPVVSTLGGGRQIPPVLTPA